MAVIRPSIWGKASFAEFRSAESCSQVGTNSYVDMRSYAEDYSASLLVSRSMPDNGACMPA